jgi:hypothetical protein
MKALLLILLLSMLSALAAAFSFDDYSNDDDYLTAFDEHRLASCRSTQWKQKNPP